MPDLAWNGQGVVEHKWLLLCLVRPTEKYYSSGQPSSVRSSDRKIITWFNLYNWLHTHYHLICVTYLSFKLCKIFCGFVWFFLSSKSSWRAPIGLELCNALQSEYTEGSFYLFFIAYINSSTKVILPWNKYLYLL